MGLAEQRKKQRIGEDPQNNTWSKDTSRFGFKMLEKMGWSSGKGLGAKEDGIMNHIKPVYKVDQRGLGADAKTCDNWIENTSGFSQLLAKLNQSQPSTSEQTEASEEQEVKDKSKKKKKKRSSEEISEKSTKKEKKSKKDKKDKSNKKAKKEDTKEKDSSESAKELAPSTNMRLSHRAKYVRNKKLSTSDPSNLKAIFGLRG